jgi:hypothetical protein
MPRKFVTGGAGKVVVEKTRELIEMPCQGCGMKMKVMSDHVGDVLCSECMKPKGYELHVK